MGRVSFDLTSSEFQKKISDAEKKNGVVMIGCGHQLYIKVSTVKRIKTWFYRDLVSQKYIRLGEFPTLSLSMARVEMEKMAAQLQQERASGEVKEKIPTFGSICEKWLNTKLNLARIKNIKSCCKYMYPLFDFPVDQIRNSKVKEVLLSQNIPAYTLRETLAYIVNIMDLAIEDEYIDHHSLNVLKRSPVLPKVKKGPGYKWVPLKKFNELFGYLEKLDPFYKRYYLLLSLTCLRPGECRQLRFSYLNLRDQCIEIPGVLMKVKTVEPFRVPLTRQIHAVWQNIKTMSADQETDFLFPRKRSNTPIVERDLSVPFQTVTGGIAQPHGFRKSARTFFAEKGVPTELAAMCLAHRINFGADNAYQKSDLLELRREVMQSWSDAVEAELPDFMKLYLHSK